MTSSLCLSTTLSSQLVVDVDFDNMMRRMRAYKADEDAARQRERDHICNIGLN